MVGGILYLYCSIFKTTHVHINYGNIHFTFRSNHYLVYVYIVHVPINHFFNFIRSLRQD